MERQVRGRGPEDPGGSGDPSGSAPGGNGRAVHVPQHQGLQAASACQRRTHGKVTILSWHSL